MLGFSLVVIDKSMYFITDKWEWISITWNLDFGVNFYIFLVFILIWERKIKFN